MAAQYWTIWPRAVAIQSTLCDTFYRRLMRYRCVVRASSRRQKPYRVVIRDDVVVFQLPEVTDLTVDLFGILVQFYPLYGDHTLIEGSPET